MTADLAPVITPARYAKGCVSVRCPSDGSGFKTRAMRLAEHVKGRWSNREKAYVMSDAKGRRLVDLFNAGRDASSVTAELKPLP